VKWPLLGIMIASTTASDLLQSHAMKREGEQSAGLGGVKQILQAITRNRDVILSIVCLAFSFFSFMALVQAAPLSFAVPASAGSFIVETVFAKFLLKEQIGFRRGMGTMFVFLGIVLVGR
jgi:uncharacterized membrane protein